MSEDDIYEIEPNPGISYIPIPETHNLTGKESNSHDTGEFNLIRWKSGKRVDQRLLTLLKFFQELFVERREFFKEIFPGLQREFSELFRKINAGFSTRDARKSRAIKRSVSFDVARGSGLKLGRFKVQTPDLVIEAQPSSSQGGEGDNKHKS